ncbi:MAG TPA: ABC transporter ATP-binding protein [Clostridiaceae bacterium]|jgi:ATP-binding cassette subfamily B protein|nr:ABC transporter ATP-binding protein [Clostridiaceae bacterium]
MSKMKLLRKFMKGNLLLYTGAIISVALATVASMISPLVLRTVIDSIIGGKPIEAPDFIIRIIENLGGRTYIAQNLWLCAIVLVVVSVLNGIFLYTKGKWSSKAAESIAKNMRDWLYDKLQNLSYDYHVKAETGDLIQRCTSDVETVRRFIGIQLVEIGRALFILTAISFVLFRLDTELAMVSLAMVPVIFLYSYFYFKKVKKSFKASDEAEGRLSNVLQENLTGVRVVRAFGRQAYEVEKFKARNLEFKDITYELIRLLAWYWSVSGGICMLQIGAVFVMGVYRTAIGEMSLGTLTAFNTYIGMLLWPVRYMGRILTDLGKMMVSLDRIGEILNKEDERSQVEGEKPPINGDIKFKNVYFEYEKGKPVLKDLTFDIPEGKTVAILGSTGSGKSSLVHLLQRLYDYQDGSITIGGVELKRIDKKWLRQHIGIVLQEPFLFSKTIKENISLACTNTTDEEVCDVAKTASIHDVILNFEKGYETPVGEKGVTLSGGQKQRVAIARTIIRNCPILIFDDSLSAVDTETDAAIRKALKERSRDVTTIIISHRITTLSEADKIIVLEQGKVTQSGTHEQLIQEEGLYKRIWELQSSLEDELYSQIEHQQAVGAN